MKLSTKKRPREIISPNLGKLKPRLLWMRRNMSSSSSNHSGDEITVVSPRGDEVQSQYSHSQSLQMLCCLQSSNSLVLATRLHSAVCTRRCKFYSAFFVSICIMRLEHCEVVQSGQFPVQNTCSRIRNIRDRAAEFYVFTHCPMLTCLVIRSDYFRYRWTSTTST